MRERDCEEARDVVRLGGCASNFCFERVFNGVDLCLFSSQLIGRQSSLSHCCKFLNKFSKKEIIKSIQNLSNMKKENK